MSIQFTANQGGRCQTATNQSAIGTGDYTLSCWIKVSSHVDDGGFFGCQGDSGLLMTIREGLSSGSYYFSHNIVNTKTLGLTAFPTGSWLHVCTKRSGTTCSLFLNGVKDRDDFTSSFNFSDGKLTVGGNLNGARNPSAKIFDAAMWNTALSDAIIARIYNEKIFAESFSPNYAYYKLDQTTGTPATGNAGLANQVVGGLPLTVIASSGMSWQNDNPVLVLDPTAASSPTPSDLSSDTNVETGLSWTPGDNNASFDVYFGTSNPPPYVTTQTETSYNPTLESETTYYWKIVSKNGTASVEGSVWRFTTAESNGVPETYASTSYGTIGSDISVVERDNGELRVTGRGEGSYGLVEKDNYTETDSGATIETQRTNGSWGTMGEKDSFVSTDNGATVATARTGGSYGASAAESTIVYTDAGATVISNRTENSFGTDSHRG